VTCGLSLCRCISLGRYDILIEDRNHCRGQEVNDDDKTLELINN
jgi:hypothetical protein